ncbi:MAG: DNA-3-methyladenine glycosylase [Demequina sp.]
MRRTALARPAHEVTSALLGAHLTHDGAEGTVTVEVTEVEAYAGTDDPASHAYRGRTERNRVMFGQAGHLYVYFSYGMHWCANIVTGSSGQSSALLLRAGRVINGLDAARHRRGPRTSDRDLARGPACLAQALGIDAALKGADVLGGSPLTLTSGRAVSRQQISTGPRVGVRLAADVPWRFWITDEPTVSAYKRHPRATDE